MKILKKLEETFAAAAFAEAGEFETARDLAKGSRKVLLVLTGNMADTKSFTYALNVAKRIEADLEIMVIAGKEPDSDLLGHCQELLEQNGIEFHITRVEGCMKTEMLEYTTKRSNIQFVVAESIDALNDECQVEDRSLRGTLKSLCCPLVLISELKQD